jgi:hypothetical protein
LSWFAEFLAGWQQCMRPPWEKIKTKCVNFHWSFFSCR